MLRKPENNIRRSALEWNPLGPEEEVAQINLGGEV